MTYDPTLPKYDASSGAQLDEGIRAELIPGNVLLAVGKVLTTGAKSHEDTNERWRATPTPAHVGRALVHIYTWLADGETEELIHAICRLMFAAAIQLDKRKS